MHKPARTITADEYIRRIDRMVFFTSTIVIVLAAGLFVQLV